jgi:branched-chain amino acid transport system permease protein
MRRALPILAVMAALIVLPLLLTNDFYINLVSQILIFALLALSLNILLGWGGMVSLGHAVYLGMAAYACAWLVTNTGMNQLAAAAAALLITTVMAAVFGVLSLRATGLGFLMITLALGQIMWGLGYRWASLTGGDNGIRLAMRPMPFGVDLMHPVSFYYFTLIVFCLALYCIWRFVRSPFGASLAGTRDQPRRMKMLGFNVWLIRWMAFVTAGFWGGVAGLLYVYYHQFIHPQSLSLQQSAEVLLMTLLGGAGTLTGPIVGAAIITLMKNVVSTYVDRWYTLLGAIFILATMFMPRGIVPGIMTLLERRQAKAERRRIAAARNAKPAEVRREQSDREAAE